MCLAMILIMHIKDNTHTKFPRHWTTDRGNLIFGLPLALQNILFCLQGLWYSKGSAGAKGQVSSTTQISQLRGGIKSKIRKNVGKSKQFLGRISISQKMTILSQLGLGCSHFPLVKLSLHFEKSPFVFLSELLI